MKTDVEGDLTYLEGFDKLSAEDQAKVQRAIDQGHIDDDDLSSHQDPEQNRPGAKKRRTPKKKQTEEVGVFITFCLY